MGLCLPLKHMQLLETNSSHLECRWFVLSAARLFCKGDVLHHEKWARKTHGEVLLPCISGAGKIPLKGFLAAGDGLLWRNRSARLAPCEVV